MNIRMRRMNGRSPNILIGVILVLSFTSLYRLWTLTSERDDLQADLARFLENAKIRSLKISQLEKKNQLLQGTLQESQKETGTLKENLSSGSRSLEDANKKVLELQKSLSHSKNEITEVKTNEARVMKELEEVKKRLETETNQRETLQKELQNAKEENEKKDQKISELEEGFKKQEGEPEKLKSIQENVQHKESVKPMKEEEEIRKIRDSAAPLGEVPRKEVGVKNVGMNGMKQHPGYSILPREPSSVKRKKPLYATPGKPENEEAPVLKQPDSLPSAPQTAQDNNENNVIPAPPDNKKIEEEKLQKKNENVGEKPNALGNLDAADDDLGKNEEEFDDEDEEADGDAPDNVEDAYRGDDFGGNPLKEPRGIGNAALPRPKNQGEVFDDVNMIDDAAGNGNERLAEANLNDNIKNLGAN